jgi:hypothetical protein
MPRCLYCGGELGENALYCPRCLVPITPPERRRRPGTFVLILGVFLATAIPCFWVLAGQMKKSAPLSLQAAGTTATAPLAPDEAQALIARCGPPDRDVSSADSDPPPPIPFRVLEYQAQHLQFTFVPGGGAKMGDPPPYRWALSGILDTTTNESIPADLAGQRMSCLGSPGTLDMPPSATAAGAVPGTEAGSAPPANPQH